MIILCLIGCVLIGLNEGEHLHSLARDLAFGRQGRFHDGGYEAQLNRVSALSLEFNAMSVIWYVVSFRRKNTERPFLKREMEGRPSGAALHVSLAASVGLYG